MMEAVRLRWGQAGTRGRAIVLFAIAGVAALGFLAYVQTREPARAVLFSGLAAEDAAAVLEALNERHVSYSLAEEGTTILVPEDQVHETRLALASGGLPAGGTVGFELFDESRFGESEFAEQVQYRRALEGELARTIGHIEGVERARVHLVLPHRTLLSGDETHASASVALHLRAGRHLATDQVRGLVHLVASSVRGLAAEDVTIVDGDGRRLAGGGENDAESASDAEGLRDRIAHARERAVQELLDTTLGPNTSAVRVTADVTFATEEHVEEAYDPTRVATRSFELTTDGGEEGAAGTGGIPGAVSALPGGPAPEAGVAGAGTGGRRSEIRNFEVTKILHRSVEPALRLSRLSVAVLVDGTYEGEGESRRFVPRSAEDMARIRAVVASAAGLVESRDQITVECVPFVAREAEIEPEPSAFGEPATLAIGAGAAVVVIAALLGAWVVARRRVRPSLPALAAPPAQVIPIHPADEPLPEEAESLHALALEVARRDPVLAARVVRGWLTAPAPTSVETTPPT